MERCREQLAELVIQSRIPAPAPLGEAVNEAKVLLAAGERIPSPSNAKNMVSCMIPADYTQIIGELITQV